MTQTNAEQMRDHMSVLEQSTEVQEPVADVIAQKIMDDLDDRAGILDGVDDDIRSDMYSAIRAIVLAALSRQSAQPVSAEREQIRNEALEAENLELHRKLAAAELDARNAWSRYENANSSRLTTERQLESIRSLQSSGAGGAKGRDKP